MLTVETVKNGVFVSLTPPGCSPVETMETFDLGVSFYGNEHGTPMGVKVKRFFKHLYFDLKV